MKDTVMVIGAHNDDQILGAGGSIARYTEEGKQVIVIVFSYGEMALPWLKKKDAIKTRVKESHESDRLLGIKRTYYLGLEEGKFLQDDKPKKKLLKLIKKYAPSKILTHSEDDPHPDHRAVHKVVKELKPKCDIFTFDVWNPIKIRRRNEPRLVVDVSTTFPKKIKAVNLHKSQKPTIFSLIWNVYFSAFMNGLKNDVKYAEVFYKLR